MKKDGKTLYLVRHGETLFNVQKKKQGWCDSPLTKRGIQQAESVKRYFEENGITFDHAYCSTSERASDTLEIITDMKYSRVKGLKEWNFGAFEAKDEFLSPKPPFGDFYVEFGGESEEELCTRIDGTIRGLMDREENKCVLMVSHGGSIMNFTFMHMKDAHTEFQAPLPNCAIMKYSYEDGVFHLEEQIDPAK